MVWRTFFQRFSNLDWELHLGAINSATLKIFPAKPHVIWAKIRKYFLDPCTSPLGTQAGVEIARENGPTFISITYDDYDSHSFLLQSILTPFPTPTTWTMMLRHPNLSLAKYKT